MSNFEQLIKEKSNEELLQIVANSQDWQPEFVTLAKQELEEVRGITSETISEFAKSSTEKSDAKEEKIHGWLSFLMFAIGLGSLIAVFYNFYSMSFSDYDTEQGYAMQMFGFISGIILEVGIFAIAIYTIISFYQYKPNAVALAKIYVIAVFVTNLIGLLSGELESNGTSLGSVGGAVRSLIWGIIWFVYLSQSEQVKTLFPKENRKLYKRDKIILVSIFTPLIIWFISVFAFAFGQSFVTQKQIQEYTISESSLSFNECTDGRIIFEKPLGFLVKKMTEENEVFFSLYQGDEVSMIIYSAFDNTDTQEYFEETMYSWSDKSFEDFEFDITNEKHYLRNGNSIYLKTLQYHSEPIIEWTFILIFNQETTKCCLISCFSTIETEFLLDLIDSIKFK
jgi:hypothetical protein